MKHNAAPKEIAAGRAVRFGKRVERKKKRWYYKTLAVKHKKTNQKKREQEIIKANESTAITAYIAFFKL